MSFFVFACLLTAWEGCDQTGELYVRRQCLWCSVLCPCGIRVKVICDWARGLATIRGSGKGCVVSGAAPLGRFRPLALCFNLPFKRRINNLLHNFALFPTTSRAEEAELKMYLVCFSCKKFKRVVLKWRQLDKTGAIQYLLKEFKKIRPFWWWCKLPNHLPVIFQPFWLFGLLNATSLVFSYKFLFSVEGTGQCFIIGNWTHSEKCQNYHVFGLFWHYWSNIAQRPKLSYIWQRCSSSRFNL